ncbi:MAG: hypothetical protein R3C05_00905 [Pirellulaceae bacterium]
MTCRPRLFSIAIVASAITLSPELTAREILLPSVATDWKQLAAEADSNELIDQFSRILEDQWRQVELTSSEPPSSTLSKSEQVFALNATVRQRIDQLWQLRVPIGQAAGTVQARRAAAGFLKTISAWVEFSGRLRFMTREHTQQAVKQLPRADVKRLIASAQKHQIGVVAPAIAFVLVQPPPGNNAVPFDNPTRLQLLEVIRTTREIDASASLFQLAQWPHTPDPLRLQIMKTMRAIGMPQGSNADASGTAEAMLTHIEKMDASVLAPGDIELRSELKTWLDSLVEHGVTGNTFRWGSVEIRSGDWILQRNPSPYNRFTDLSPGLFTHVGIATEVVDDAGIRRIVIVDLPETGTRIQSEAADQFVSSSLHWIVLRHRRSEAAEAMGRVAAQLIGRASEFDLTFNLDLIPQQRGILSTKAPVRTYCAGFLALCAQEAGLQQDDLFPLTESPSSERCLANLEKLGMTMTQFISPSGPLFSSDLEIVGTRPPMYAPDNVIREAVYDRFASRMAEDEFQMHETSTQRLRQQLAEISSEYTWVRAALAKVNDVNPALDLVVAGRVATLVENLDAIADAQSQAFSDALTLVRSSGLPANLDEESQLRMQRMLTNLRSEHPEWFAKWRAGDWSMHTLRQTLVQHYCQAGRHAVDVMFFSNEDRDS